MTKRVLFSIALTLGLLLGAVTTQAAEEGGGLMPAHANVHDTASLQRGARTFFNYCVGCHSLKYQRYSRIAQDLGLSEQEVMSHLNFTGAKFGETVVSAMPAADATK